MDWAKRGTRSFEVFLPPRTNQPTTAGKVANVMSFFPNRQNRVEAIHQPGQITPAKKLIYKSATNSLEFFHHILSQVCSPRSILPDPFLSPPSTYLILYSPNDALHSPPNHPSPLPKLPKHPTNSTSISPPTSSAKIQNLAVNPVFPTSSAWSRQSQPKIQPNRP